MGLSLVYGASMFFPSFSDVETDEGVRVEFDSSVLGLGQRTYAKPAPRTYQPEKDPVVDHTVRVEGIRHRW